jgi:HAD superfamily hydrolase (TIGR01459 family)
VLFDQFGVLHDGAKPLFGAVECVQRLRQRNTAMALLSNTSKRAQEALKRITALGFAENSFVGAITSGESAYKHLSTRYRGQACTAITWASRDDAYDRGLDLKYVPVEAADVLLFHGSEVLAAGDKDVPLRFMSTGILDTKLMEVLHIAASKNIPAVCANMDEVAVLPSGDLGYMPGIVTQQYQRLGGKVAVFGKPLTEHFDEAIALTGTTDRSRILHVRRLVRCVSA